MKIYSGFRDYYDIGGFGEGDETIVFNRVSKIHDWNDMPSAEVASAAQSALDDMAKAYDRIGVRDWMGKPTPFPPIQAAAYHLNTSKHTRDRYRIRYQNRNVFPISFPGRGILGFCGRLYSYVCLDVTPEKTYEKIQLKTFFSMKQLFRFLSSVECELRSPLDYLTHWDRAEDWNGLLPDHENATEHLALFLELNSPLFVIRPTNRSTDLIVNPCLKEMDFQSVKDPYTAHQDIDMFVSGILTGPTVGEAQMSDKEKVISKGMDPEYGFRQKGPKPRKSNGT